MHTKSLLYHNITTEYPVLVMNIIISKINLLIVLKFSFQFEYPNYKIHPKPKQIPICIDALSFQFLFYLVLNNLLFWTIHSPNLLISPPVYVKLLLSTFTTLLRNHKQLFFVSPKVTYPFINIGKTYLVWQRVFLFSKVSTLSRTGILFRFITFLQC